jgi:zinc transport system ATP-binding protein
MKPIIQLENVYFKYGDTSVLTNVNLSIQSCEFIGIIGPNGGGKTTFLKLLMGFLKPTSGKLEIFGTSPQTSRHQIAYVPQTQRFDRDFPISVLELVLSGRLFRLPWYGKFSKEDKEIAQAALERVHLADFRYLIGRTSSARLNCQSARYQP